jgi:hypothetical protein
MNWQELKQKITPYIDTAKVYTGKAVDFTHKQVQGTPIFLRTLSEFESTLVDSKRLILIGYDEKDPIRDTVLLMGPVWTTQAWSDNAQVRFFSLEQSPDLVSHFQMHTPIDFRVFFTARETYHATDLDHVKSWWKDRCYITEGSEGEEVPSNNAEKEVP